MRITIAIDPGYAKRGRGCAVALFADGVLANWWFARASTAGRIFRRYDDSINWIKHELPCIGVPNDASCLVVAEQPQVDDRTHRNAQPVVKLAWEGALLAGVYAGQLGCAVESVTPQSWKGSVPKPVYHHRLWSALTPDERLLLGDEDTNRHIEAACRAGGLDRWSKPGASYYPVTWLLHNVLDAVGIGAWKEGRIK